MRIAMTGSSGTIGTALRARLEAAGHEIVRLRNGDRDSGADWNSAEGWIRDGALDGTEVVVHLAGASIGDVRWNATTKEEMRVSRIEGARVLVDAIRGMVDRPKALITMSAVGVYGDRADERLTEESSSGSGFLAGLVVDWEAEAFKAQELGVRVVALRTGVIPRSMLPALITPFKLGLGGRLGSGKQYFPWVAFDDVLSAFEYAITSDVSGPINVVGPQEVTNAKFTKDLGGAIKRPTIFPLPAFMLKLIMGGEKAKETALVSLRVVPQRLLDAPGFEFKYRTLAEALPEELAAI
jgi:hypothetical protein